jgi:hypothetical protein
MNSIRLSEASRWSAQVRISISRPVHQFKEMIERVGTNVSYILKTLSSAVVRILVPSGHLFVS